MEYQVSSTAPDAGSVLKFVASLVRKSKWLIAAAAVLAAVVTYALTAASTSEVWSGRAILTVGTAPSDDFLAHQIGATVLPIEAPRRTVARLSEPAFKEQVVNQAAFEPATAAISRSMVTSSLRGIVIDRDRDIAIELSAGSAADVQAAFRAVAAEIGAVHDAIRDRQIQILQNRIDRNKSRIAEIEKETSELNDRILKTSPSVKNNEHPRLPDTPAALASIFAWNELQMLTTVEQLSEPSVLHLEADKILVSHRSVDRLRASLLAGAGMLIAMIILTIIISPPGRPRED